MLDTEFWVDSFLSALKKCCFTSFWPPWFLMTKSVIQIVVSQSVTCFLWLLLRFKKNFFLVFIFNNLVMMCLGVDFLAFILFGVHWDPSPNSAGLSFARFGTYSAIIYSKIFFSITFFSSPSETPVTQMWDFLVFSHMSRRICPFFSNLFSLYYSDWIISIDIKFTVFSAISISLPIQLGFGVVFLNLSYGISQS